jgi:Tol biopolymer transport system component/DNA-binding winged helix-turn-helix (wHTH) protein
MNRTDDGTLDVLYVFGAFVADPVRGLLRRNGEAVALPPKAFEVLIALVERRGKVVEKDDLLRLIWPNTVVEENNLARHISTLRKVLRESISEHVYIVTVPGRGYRFVAVVREIARADQPSQTTLDSEKTEAPRPEEPSVEAHQKQTDAQLTPLLVPPVARGTAARVPRALIGLVASLFLIVSFTGTQALLPRSGEGLGMPHRKLWQLTFSPGVHDEPTWSPDGRWIAYSSDHAGNSDIWVQPITAENPVQLTSSLGNDWQPAWSPDGKYLAFRSERSGGGLYIVPARGGVERKIADFGYKPQWSRDGLKILFYGPLRSANSRSTELFVVDLDGGPPRQILPDLLPGFQSFRASWYPEGQRVSVYGIRRGQDGPGLWTVSLSGRDLVHSEMAPDVTQHLKEAEVNFTNFVWSPRGDALFFEGASEDVTNVWRVMVNPATLRWTAGPDRLTTGAELNNNISVSSDGSRIAFSLRSEKTRLWSLPFDALAGRILGAGEPFTAEGADAPYDVSSDGQELAYRAVRQGKQELWKRSLASGQDRLLLTAGSISAPRWSPDGSRLVYRRDFPAALPGSPVDRAVTIMTVNGGQERLLTVPRPMNGGEQLAPFDWSSDGSKILSACPTGQSGNMGVCVFSLVGTSQAEPDLHVIASRPNYSLFEAQFSPDARWVCFNAITAPGISTIYVVPVDGGEWTAVTDGRFWGDKPRWAPDGRAIYFTSTRAGFVNVWGRRFDPARGIPTGEPFPVTSFETPSRMLLPRIMQLHIALVRKHLILPITDVSSSIWVLDNVNQ